jgi:hypothetical protein
MHLFEIVSFVVAFAGSASKLLTAAKPFWNKLPTPIAALLPSVCMMLPTLAEKVGGSTTTVDFVSALVVSLALLLPGHMPVAPAAPAPAAKKSAKK